ncbi:MAG: VanW family protein [Oscillospiraceae bacterium]
MKKRKLFCEISPLTYKISVAKCCLFRTFSDLFPRKKFAKSKLNEPLKNLVYSSKSLIRRKLGNANPLLQENKAINLKLSAPKVTGILIKPNEIFSFWKLVGSCTAKKGYKEGLTINSGKVSSGIGGGMCQFTNLLHWLVLHTPLEIVEHHHHDGLDLFPDFGRTIPFGTGTSILYNYLDYRFVNKTSNTFQIIISLTDKYFCGEIRSAEPLSQSYHIVSEDENFTEESGIIYRNGNVFRECVDKKTGDLLSKQLIKVNHAKVLYDTSGLEIIHLGSQQSQTACKE